MSGDIIERAEAALEVIKAPIIAELRAALKAPAPKMCASTTNSPKPSPTVTSPATSATTPAPAPQE